MVIKCHSINKWQYWDWNPRYLNSKSMYFTTVPELKQLRIVTAANNNKKTKMIALCYSMLPQRHKLQPFGFNPLSIAFMLRV